MRCGAVQTRGVLGESKTSERFEACCIRLAGGRKGGKQLAAGQSLVGMLQPREGTRVSRRADGLLMWMGCDRMMILKNLRMDDNRKAAAAAKQQQGGRDDGEQELWLELGVENGSPSFPSGSSGCVVVVVESYRIFPARGTPARYIHSSKQQPLTSGSVRLPGGLGLDRWPWGPKLSPTARETLNCLNVNGPLRLRIEGVPRYLAVTVNTTHPSYTHT